MTSVGGTTLAIGSHGNYEWETGWGDDAARLAASGTSWADLPGAFTMGAGGGTSPLFRQPAYQRGVVPASLSHANGSAVPMRVVPDIAADADPLTGTLIGETRSAGAGQPASYGEGSAGGTSASTPLIAGLQADAQQAAGTPIGFANPVIYGPDVRLDAAIPAPAGTEPPQLYTFGLDEGLAAGPGYDDVTGVGTPAPCYFTSRCQGGLSPSSRWAAARCRSPVTMRSVGGMIEARGLTKRYDGTAVVTDLTFAIRPGMVTGFLGPNGAAQFGSRDA